MARTGICNFDWDNQATTPWEPKFGARAVKSNWLMHQNATWDILATGKAAFDLGFMWPWVFLTYTAVWRCHSKILQANVNSIPVAAWTLMRIVADTSLVRNIRSEIAPACSLGSSESVDINRLSKCTLSQSVVAEAFRLLVAVTNESSEFTNHSPLIIAWLKYNIGSIIPNFRIEKWKLKPKHIILGSKYFSRGDENALNTGRTLDDVTQEHPLDKFWAERFLKYPNDTLAAHWEGSNKGMSFTLALYATIQRRNTQPRAWLEFTFHSVLG